MRAAAWRDALPWALGLLLAAALAAWLLYATEWVEQEIDLPAKGEAAINPLYAAQALARTLGAQVIKQTSLDPLPPPDATLVLTSWNWRLLPGREKALRDWVRQGGHLVLPGSLLPDDDDALKDWLPVRRAKAKTETETKTGAKTKTETKTKAKAKAKAKTETPLYGSADDECHYLAETGALAGPGFRVCWPLGTLLELKPGASSLWSANDHDGHPVLLRAAAGQGSVTVIGIWDAMTDEDILKADHAQAWTAALDLRPGMALWFVTEETRPPLLAWLWQQAWIVLLLGLLALAAWLWRGAARFGPLEATPRVERRSMAEQIIGTAHFLARNSPRALHQAQLRALDEAAAPRLRGYAALGPDARARRVAASTGLPADAVADAMTVGARDAARLEADLCCLETAARRLRAGAASKQTVAQAVAAPAVHSSS